MKGSYNMLSVNSNPTSVTAFKGKPSSKELKKLYQTIDKLQFEQYLKNPKISKAEKQETLMKETAVKAMELWTESSAKKFVNKILKK